MGRRVLGSLWGDVRRFRVEGKEAIPKEIGDGDQRIVSAYDKTRISAFCIYGFQSM